MVCCTDAGDRRSAWLLLPLPTVFCLPPIAYCLRPTAHSLLPSAYSLLPSAYSLLPSAYSLLPVAHCLLPESNDLADRMLRIQMYHVMPYILTSHRL